MPKASNIRTLADDVFLAEPTVTILWDLVDDDGTVLVADLMTSQENFETESKAVIDSYVQDTVPAGEEP